MKFLQISLSTALILIYGISSAQEKEAVTSGFVVDKIIGRVDNYIILKSDLDNAYQDFLAQGNPKTDEGLCFMLQRLVMNKMMVAKADIDSITVTDQEIDQNLNQRMNTILANFNNSQEQLERQYNKTFEQTKAELKDGVREQLLAREMSRKVTKDIKITPSEVKKFYSKIPKDSLPYFSADIEVGQIVKYAKVSDEQKDEAKEKLRQLRERLMNGDNWNELARTYSEDPSVVQNGGEMGYAGRSMMDPAYEATAFRLRKGEISQPFESSFGFHILQLIDRRGNEYNSRHILMSAIPSKDDLDRATLFLDSIGRKIMKDSLKFEKAAIDFSDDKATKGHGGFFTDPDGSTRMRVSDLDPVIYLTIDSMKVGSISRPMMYRIENSNKDAVRIIHLKSKSSPHQGSLKEDWGRFQSASLAEKKNKAIDKWFTRAKQDVFINIDPDYHSCKILD